jgi:hypothetical protein
MGDFKKKSLYDIYFKMTLEEVVDYYQQLRKIQLENHDLVKGIQIRKALYGVVKVILMLDALAGKRKVTILNDDRNTTLDYISRYKDQGNPYELKKHPKIYAATHMGRYDCESVVQAINENANILMSDPGVSYKDIDGIMLRLMGVTWFDHDVKEDRRYANERETEVLRQGGNCLLFPEAGYCIDPIAPVGEIHPGFAKRAIKTKANIVPISLEQYENDGIKNYIVNIGNTVLTNGTNLGDAEDLSFLIRDEMIRLKKEIWAIYGGAKPTEEEFKNDPFALDKYKERIDFMMRDVPSYYKITNIVKELYRPSEVAIKALKDISYL